jgi:dihydropteroate synthase
LQRDPAMAEVVAEARALVVIMHNREETEEGIDIVEDMQRFFERSLEVAARAGVAERFILLDPGVGFGKTRMQNYAALRAIPRLRSLGFPVLVGVSRKSIFRDLSGERIDGRLLGTLAANIVAAGLGAQIFRVHDVLEHKAAFAVLEALHFGEQ